MTDRAPAAASTATTRHSPAAAAHTTTTATPVGGGDPGVEQQLRQREQRAQRGEQPAGRPRRGAVGRSADQGSACAPRAAVPRVRTPPTAATTPQRRGQARAALRRVGQPGEQDHSTPWGSQNAIFANSEATAYSPATRRREVVTGQQQVEVEQDHEPEQRPGRAHHRRRRLAQSALARPGRSQTSQPSTAPQHAPIAMPAMTPAGVRTSSRPATPPASLLTPKHTETAANRPYRPVPCRSPS